MKINQAITKLSLFMALGIGLVNAEYAKANNNLAQCFNNNVKYEILAHYEGMPEYLQVAKFTK